MRDIDLSILPTSSDTKKSLIKRIASSKYLDDIVIYNPSYSVLNENIQSKRDLKGLLWDQYSSMMEAMEKVKENW